jgi:hypothetical protein
MDFVEKARYDKLVEEKDDYKEKFIEASNVNIELNKKVFNLEKRQSMVSKKMPVTELPKHTEFKDGVSYINILF